MISEEEMKSTKPPRVIVPTIGRVVWYTPSQIQEDAHVAHLSKDPLTAHVVHVHNERTVNLVVFDSYGCQHKRLGVTLVQPGDTKPQGGRFCEWMPYQQGQAAKTDAVTDPDLAEMLKDYKAHKGERAKYDEMRKKRIAEMEKTLAETPLDAKPGVDPFEPSKE